MKRWVEPSGGGRELDGIRADIRALQNDRCAVFMLITREFDPRGEDQYQWLADKLADFHVKREDFEIHSFPTIWVQGNERKELRFALIGFMVSPAAEKADSAMPGQE